MVTPRSATRSESSPDDALPRIISEHELFVYSTCLAFCGDEDRARDLTQETFVRVYRGWEAFEGRSSVSTWLYTIARRTCSRLERRRAGEPRKRVDLESVGDRVPATDAVPETDYAAFDPLEHLIEEETADLVRRAISHLPIRYRLPLVLKEMAGLPVHDVATLLHLTEGTVKSRLFRARALLEPELAPVASAGSPPSSDGCQGGDADRIRRSDRLCPNCRPLFGDEDRAARICDAVVHGEESPEFETMLRHELSRCH